MSVDSVSCAYENFIGNESRISIVKIFMIFFIQHMLTYINMIYPDTKLEEELWNIGHRYVVGLDEAGRGPLAGPVVAGAVLIENVDQVVKTVRDSKKMTSKQRDLAFDEIKNISTAYGIGIVDSKRIDEIGIKYAVLEAMTDAVHQVEKKLSNIVDYVLADGGIYLIKGYEMRSINHGDLNHYSIAAASVLAKVTRDRIMYEYAKKYPNYGFDSHVGYGTKKHMEAIQEYGICDIHRRSFAPISKMLEK